MLRAVVVSRVVGARDGDGHVDRVDGLVAVGDVERNCLEVGVGVRELPRRQAHVRGAGIGAYSRIGTGEREVLSDVVQLAIGSCRIAGDRVLFAVVVGRVVRTDNGHGRINRVNSQRAIDFLHVREVGRLVLAGSVLDDVAVDDDVSAAARVRLRAGRGRLDREAFRQAGSGYLLLARAVGCQWRTVVILRVGRGCKRNLDTVL